MMHAAPHGDMGAVCDLGGKMDLSELVVPCRLDRMTGMVALTDAAPSSPMRRTWQMSDLDGTRRSSGYVANVQFSLDLSRSSGNPAV